MNLYTFFPVIAIIAYVPLLITTISSRPWQRRHRLFAVFLIAAILWSLADLLLRSNYLREYDILLGKCVIVLFAWMAVQFHSFTSSFYTPDKGRWLPFTYTSLAVIIAMVILGYLPEGIEVSGESIYPVYGQGVIVLAALLIIMTTRTVYVYSTMLRNISNPVLHSQLTSLLFGIGFLGVFTIAAVLPWGRNYPVSHFGNLMNAFILSYAVIRHRLVDIRLVLRQGIAWLTLGIIGAASYWFLLYAVDVILGFQLNLIAMSISTLLAIIVAIFVYKLRRFLFEAISRVFQGSTYDYRQQLSDFTSTIHNVFSLKEQGGELLVRITKAIGIQQACLLFPETGGDDFFVQIAEPQISENVLNNLKLNENHPIVRYLEREQKILTRENLAILPEFLGLWEQEKEELNIKEVEVFIPLISRDHLIAILVLGRKRSGKYLLEDFQLLEDITRRVAVTIEKEFLREQLREREEELSLINRSSAIITSSLDMQEIYDIFIQELKNVLDVCWAAIVLVEENGLRFQALSSDVEYTRQVGERVTMEDSGTKWVVNYKTPVIENDLSREIRFSAGNELLQQGIRSVAYLPLLAKGEAIGSFIVASRNPNAYGQRQVKLLEQLAYQIAMPVENSRLYAMAAKRARIDELTGLFNRRSLDEVIESEISRHSRYGGAFSLAILDLDSFKAYNDTFGHLAGDKLLGNVGTVIRNAIRNSDQAFRYGGDEFAVLLPETSTDAASKVLERVRRKIANRVAPQSIKITASIGMASWPADGVGQIDIFAAADGALYEAKRNGGNRINYASGALLSSNGMDPYQEGSIDSKTLN